MKATIEQLRDNARVLLGPVNHGIPASAIAGALHLAANELDAARVILEPLAEHDPEIRAWLKRTAGRGCSDFVRHYHRWRWSAWLCGRWQWLCSRFNGRGEHA